MFVNFEHEFVDNVIRWRGPVQEEEVMMFDPLLCEEFVPILSLIKSDHEVYSLLLEYLDVLCRVFAEPLLCVRLLDGPHEGHELARNDPVKVAVLDLLVVLVVLRLERVVSVPPELDGILQSLQTLEQRALVVAVPLAGVSVRLEVRDVVLEVGMGLFSSLAVENDQVATHEEGTVHHLIWFR